MEKEVTEMKTFNMRIPYKAWKYLKHLSAEHQISMAQVVLMCMENYREGVERGLHSAELDALKAIVKRVQEKINRMS